MKEERRCGHEHRYHHCDHHDDHCNHHHHSDHHHCNHYDQECVRAEFKKGVQYGPNEELLQSAKTTGEYHVDDNRDDRVGDLLW